MEQAKRRVPASDSTSKIKPWALTNAQWTLYYWLLAHSYWNSFDGEGHYFIYRNSYTNTQIMKDTGIKSPQTVNTAFAKLKEVGAIVQDMFHDGALQIQTIDIFAPIDIIVLKFLLNFNKYIDPAISITMLAIIYRWFLFNGEKPIKFTKSELSKLMGKSKRNTDDAGVVLALALLSQYGLLEMTQDTYTNRLKVTCVQYKVTKVSLTGNKVISSIFNDDEEPDNKKIEQLWQEICSITWTEMVRSKNNETK